MRTSKFTIYADNSQRKYNDFDILNQKIKKTRDSLLLNQVNLTETFDDNKDNKLHKKFKINICQNLNSQENGLRRSLNKINNEQKIKFNKSRVPSQKLIRNSTEDFNKFESNYYQRNSQRHININIQNINFNNYTKKINIFDPKFPQINTTTSPNIENLNNINLNNNNNNNLNDNIIIPQTNNHIKMNVFRNKFKKVKLGDLKKIKFHQNKNNIVNSERLDNKTLRVFNKIDQKNNNIPIIIKEKEELKAHKKIEIIEDTDDSFIEELTDLLIKVDTKGKLQIKRENNKNEERIQFLTEENKEEVKNDYEDLLNKKFAIYEDEEEKNEKEKKEEEIIIPNIFSNKRPPTSYGGVNERERSIQNSIRSKNQKNY